MGTLGVECKKTPKARVTPTYGDIRQAAGFWEGEGSASRTGGTFALRAGQKDPWPLYRLQEIFGGSVIKRRTQDLWIWSVFGSRARGVAYTIFSFLSPRRRMQLRHVLSI